MYSRFEKDLVTHCASTLAGHKAGSMFSYRLTKGETPHGYIDHINALLADKNVQARILKLCSKCCLVYVYRPSMLENRLSCKGDRDFLTGYGYQDCTDIESHLSLLARRIYCGNNFPHEIGVFLDYPLEAVVGFICNKGCNYCCAGCWKAYSEPETARRKFELFEKCRRIYLQRYREGACVERLTVAC